MSSAVVGEKPIYFVARRWTRHKLDVPVRVIVHSEDKSRVISGRGKEISEGGMAVFAGVELHTGDKVEVEFTPPYGMPIRVQALVKNRNGYSYGVEFFAVNEEQAAEKDRLRAALNSATLGA
ncbi:MAG TPA: PilZ domain-containing protein [Terriglobales bacterium]|nr:PilZ domain-containing protein [Terriglobales bacterium]